MLKAMGSGSNAMKVDNQRQAKAKSNINQGEVELAGSVLKKTTVPLPED